MVASCLADFLPRICYEKTCNYEILATFLKRMAFCLNV